jgi:hypothetical protein
MEEEIRLMISPIHQYTDCIIKEDMEGIRDVKIPF